MSGDTALPQFISRQVAEGSYYFLNLEVGPREDLAVVCGGLERCAAGYRVERSSFKYYGIEYVLSGNVRFSSGAATFDLRPGSVFGYCPETSCVIESVAGETLIKRFVDFSGTRAAELFHASPLVDGGPVNCAGVAWVEDLFGQLSEFGAREDDLARRTCRLLLEVLLLQLGEVAKARQEAETPAYRTYLRCRQHIEDRYLVLSSASEISDQMNIDQAYLSRLFKRFDEEAPYRKLVRLKMNHAARLLLSEGLAVKEVAGRVGYEDALHFSRVFKRTYGISPRHFQTRY